MFVTSIPLSLRIDGLDLEVKNTGMYVQAGTPLLSIWATPLERGYLFCIGLGYPVREENNCKTFTPFVNQIICICLLGHLNLKFKAYLVYLKFG